MKRIVCIFTALLLTLTLFSCDANSYVATGMVRSSWGGEASLKFLSFKGKQSFTLRAEPDESRLEYEASLTEGEIAVYYILDGEEKVLFTLKGGERVDSSFNYGGGDIRVRVVASDTCRGGSLEFELD
jgi:hypothetical protein